MGNQVQETQLAVIVKDSGMSKSEAQTMLEQFSEYFKIASEWEQKAKTIVVTDVSQKAEMKMAREGRLFMKSTLVEVEKTRKKLKDESLRKCQNIDSIARILKNILTPIKEHYENQEKFIEIAENKAKEERKVTREATLTALNFDYTYTDLLNMPDIQFDELVLKIENEISAKQEAGRLDELETKRLENIKKLKEERTNIAMPYYQFWSDFEKTLNFGEVSEIDFNAFIDRCKHFKQKFDEDQEKIRLENERLQKEAKEREEQLAKEREELERQLAKERKEAEEKRIEADKIARAERELIEEKARKEREELQEKNRIAEELARKEREKQAEILKKERECIEREIEAKKEEEARIAKANELAKKKAAAAPDKDKLTALIKLIEDIEMPIMATDEANLILQSVDQLLGKVCTFIEQKRDEL